MRGGPKQHKRQAGGRAQKVKYQTAGHIMDTRVHRHLTLQFRQMQGQVHLKHFYVRKFGIQVLEKAPLSHKNTLHACVSFVCVVSNLVLKMLQISPGESEQSRDDLGKKAPHCIACNGWRKRDQQFVSASQRSRLSRQTSSPSPKGIRCTTSLWRLLKEGG